MPTTPPGDGPAVEVDDLVVRYRRRGAADLEAVAGLSLTAPRGAVTAVLGPNGAGKTTTVETCEGYRSPTAGTVRVLGLDPVRDAARLRPHLGVMLQEGGVPGAVRPVEALAHAARLYAEPADVGVLAERLGLDAVAGTPYRRLSGGEQQRVKLALALVGRPSVVFLDEPTAGLDPQGRRAVWDLVEELRTDGVSVLLTTHLMDEAEQLADQVVIVDHGRTVAAGTPDELTARGAERSLRFRGRARLPLETLRAALPAASTVAEARPGSYVVEGDVDPQLLATVTAWCAGNGVLLDGLTVGRRSLEDVFLELTGTGLDERRRRSVRGPPAGVPRPARDRAPVDVPVDGPGARPAQLTLLARNGEQLLLTVVIPALLLVFGARVEVGDLGAGPRVDFLAPGVLALAVLSTAFTSQAIATGFERRYGVLKRLGSTPLTRTALLAGKAGAVLVVEAVQVVLLTAVAVALGWRPGTGWAAALLLILLGTVTFSALALLMAGTLRAEATLAFANLVYLVLLLGGGILIPLAKFPERLASIVEWLPSAALAEGLRAAFAGAAVPGQAVLVLVVWSVVGIAGAARFFRWE